MAAADPSPGPGRERCRDGAAPARCLTATAAPWPGQRRPPRAVPAPALGELAAGDSFAGRECQGLTQQAEPSAQGARAPPAGWRPAGLLTCLFSLALPRGSARPPRTPTTPSRCRRCPLASGAGLPHSPASPAGARTLRAPGKSIYLRLGSLLFLHHQSGRFKLRHLVPSSPRLSSTGRRPWAAATTRSFLSVAEDRGSYLGGGHTPRPSRQLCAL